MKLDPQHAGAQERHDCLTKALTLPVTRRIPFTERSWHTSMPFEPLSQLQNSLHNHQYRGVEMLKNPFDMALYPRLIWEFNRHRNAELLASRMIAARAPIMNSIAFIHYDCQMAGVTDC